MTESGDYELVHLCVREDWAAAAGNEFFEPAGYASDGFVHLSTFEQVHLPANRLFAGRTDMLALNLDPAKLRAPIRWESGAATDPTSLRFPHLYGLLPLDAVTAVQPYLPGPGGAFAPLTSSSQR